MGFIIFVGWIILSVVIAKYAGRKGRSEVGFFFLSLILSPLIGIFIALLVEDLKKVAEKEASRKCPYCAEMVKKEAVICRFCGKDLPPMEHLANTPIQENKNGIS